jgi:hypothetical protein
VDFSVPVTRRTNARIGFNAFSYNGDFDEDNVKYVADLKLRSVQALYDIFPFGGNFHISPGVLLHNGLKVNANATVAGGQSFSLGDEEYVSSIADPKTGTAKLDVRKAAPMFLFGYGNPIPRSKRHLTFSIEAGVVFQGSPNINLNFAGSACDSTGLNCRKITTDPMIQAEVAKEQRKLRDDASVMKFYPVVSIGLGYRF